MKLHLPKGLRSAVLACMAVVGGLTTTVGTGFVAAGAFTIAFAAQNTYEITESGDARLTSATADDKIILNITGWLTPNGTLDINAPVEIKKAEVNDGSSNRTYVFKNTITGDGIFSYCPEDGRGANNQNYVFEGDASAYSGDMSIVAGKVGSFTFKGQSGTGSVTALNASSLVTFTETAVINNSAISATTINITAGASINSAALTLTGTINLGGTIASTGKVTIGAGSIIDLTNIEDVDGVYTLFNGGTTDMSALTAESLIGVSSAGREWTFGTDGTISYVYVVNDLYYDGGTLALSEGASIGSGTFSNEDMITFRTADADVTLGATLSSAKLNIEEGVTVTLTGGGNTITVSEFILNGSLVLKDAALIANSMVVGENASLVLDAGAEMQWEFGLLPQTAENQLLVPVTIASGSLYLPSRSNVLGEVVVEDGAGLRIGGPATISKIVLNGDGGWMSDGEVVNAALFRNNGSGDINLGASLEIATDSTIQIEVGTLGIGGAVTGEVITKTGVGTLRLDGDVTNAGIVINGGTVRWGGNSSDGGTNKLACGSVTVNEGATFQINHAGADCSDVDINLNSGRLYSHDQSGSEIVSFGTLSVSGESTIEYGFSSSTSFEQVTGEGKLSIVDGDHTCSTTIDSINDFDGTIEVTGADNHQLKIGTVNQGTGKALTIIGDATFTDFAKTGAGSLVVEGTSTLVGTITMDCEGSIDLGTIALAEDVVLNYAGSSSVISLGAINSQVAITLFDVDAAKLAAGVDLGISSSVSKDLLYIVGLAEGDYTLKDSNGQWKISSSAEFSTDWDFNWGTSVIGKSPATVTEVEIQAGDSETHNALSGSPSSLTGGNNKAFVYGGAVENAHTGDSWIRVDQGSYKTIVGGNYAQNWSGGTRADFTGDSHIVIDGDAVVGSIIGGTNKDGQGPVFTGNSYISVFGGDVTAAIIGAGTNGHGSTNTFNGNTNIFVYVPLATINVNGMGGNSPGDAVIGGGANVDSQTRNNTNIINGNTNITIDLSEYTGEGTEFNKGVIGGHFNWQGTLTTSINGDTNVTIAGKEGVNFNSAIIGGSKLNAGAISITGTTNLTISGDSTFKSEVIGGTHQSGNFTTALGGVNMAISGGTFESDIVGAGWLTSGTATMGCGDVTMDLTGGTMGTVTGGYVIKGNGTADVTATIGDISVSVDGATIGTLLAGTNSERGAGTNQTITVGDITVDLISGTITGGVYAAGNAAGDAAMSVASTTVKIGADLTIGEGAIISAGYRNAKESATVTGAATILFTGSSQDRTTVSFADFTQIGVETQGSIVTIGSTTVAQAATIMGEGTLKLSGAATFTSGVTVDSTLDMAGQTVTGNVTVNGTLTSGGTAIVGDLTIGTSATLTDAAAASNINVETFTNTKGLTATGDIVVTDSLTSSAAITAGKISGSGDVTITGGTVTLTDTTDAFTNSGTTTITGATLAGTWTAADVTVGGVTIGTGADITINGGTISSALTNDGSLTLTGTINVSVKPVPGDSLYTHGTTTSTEGNGYRSTVGYYTIANGTGTLDVSGADWAVEGVGSGTGSYADGVLTYVSDADRSAYWVNTGSVEYGDNSITYDGKRETLDLGTTIKLNGGELILSGNLGNITIDTTDSVDSDQPSSVKIGDDVVLSKDSLVTAFGNGAELSGTGTYDIGNVPSLGDGVSLSDDWEGTVQMGDVVTDGSLDISALGNTSSVVKADSLSAGSISGADINLDVTMPSGGLMAPMGGGLAEGTVELTDGASSLSSLKVNTLILGTDSTVATLDVTKLDINGSLTVNNLGDAATTLITTDKLIGSFDVNLDLELLSSVKTGFSKTLLTSTDFGAATVGKFNGSEAWDILNEADMRMYSLGWDNGELTISVKNPGSPWKGEFWLNNDLAAGYGMNAGDYWDNGVAPDAANAGINEKDALFDGGTQEVIIGGIVTPRHVIIEREDRGSSAYYFQNVEYEDGSIEAGIIEAEGGLYLREGTVMMDNTSSSFAGKSSIGTTGKLVIGSGGYADSQASASFGGGLASAGQLIVGYNGNLSVENGTLNQGEMTVKGGTATLSGSEGMHGLENEGSLSVVDGGTLNVTEGLLNEGSITVSESTINVDSGDLLNYGDLTVTDGTVTVAQGDLSNSQSISLTDSTLDVETGILYNNVLSATDSSITVGDSVVNSGSISLEGGSITVTNSIETIDSGTIDLSGASLQAGSVTMADGDFTATDSTLTVDGDLSSIGSGSVILAGATVEAGSVTMADGDFTATDSTLTVAGDLGSTGTGSIMLDSSTAEAGSVTMVDGDFSATDSTLTVAGDLGFTGTGSIILDSSTAEADSVTVGGFVALNDSTLSVGSNMTSIGGLTLDGGTLQVNGDLAAGEGDMIVSGDSLVSVGGEMSTSDLALSVEGGVVDVTGGMTATNGSIDLNSGALSVGGDLAVNDGTLAVNGGDLVVEGNLLNPSDSIELNSGYVTVAGALQSNLTSVGDEVVLTVGTYEDSDSLNVAGSLTITGEGSSIATLTTSGAGSINLTEGAKLTLTDDSNIFIGDNAGEIDATGATLKLAAATTGAGNLKATALDIISAAGTVAGNITVSEIIFGALEAGDTAPALTIDSYSAAGSEPILVVLSGNPAESIAVGSYLLMSSGSALDSGDFSLSDEYEQTILKRGDIIELTDTAYQRGTENSLYAVVRGQTDAELTWNTSSADSVGGLHITDAVVDSTLKDGYATLDTIRNINVDEDQTISLVGVDRDDEADSLMLRNVNGASALSLVGDSAADDHATITSGDLAELHLENITALMGTDDSFTVGTLSGDKGSVISGSVTVTDSAVYEGGYDSAVIVGQDAAMELVSGMSLTVQTTGGTLKLNGASGSTIDSLQTSGTAVTLVGGDKGMTAPLTLVNPSSMKGGKLSFTIDPVANLGGKVIAGTLNLNGTNIAVTQANKSKVLSLTPGNGSTIIADLGNTTATATTVTLNGVAFDKYFVNARVEDGCVVADRNMTYAESLIQPESANGAAGATILSDALVNINPQADREQYPDLAALLDAVDEGRMTDADAAAVAGSSIASLGMALSGDVERQLRAIRNRTTAMGVNECVVNEGMPYFNAWVNAEGNRAELDKDGTMAGYTLDSWGGTVGFDADINPHFTAGLAITAMYGDLQVDGPDSAEGDMDTYYVSLFARYAKSAWTHTFVATMGLMDGTLARTVNAAGVNYETDGSTDGITFGLMYEVGYVMPLDEDATACLQPVFNVMLRHTSVGSYTESGSDAALDAGSQSLTTVTFGIGARLQAVVGESLYNRASILEARALAKLDAGDRQSDVDVALPGGRATANVQSAELGAFGVELGAGLTIPVGDDDGSVFIDASLELRSGYSNVNGTVGYRINF